MKSQRFKRISLLIGITMMLVIVSQMYRIYQNYQVNKQWYTNEVQASLDLAVEAYYATRAKNEMLIMTMSDEDTIDFVQHSGFSFSSADHHFDTSFHVKTPEGNSIQSYTYSYANGDSTVLKGIRSLSSDTTFIKRDISMSYTADSTVRWHGDAQDISTFVQKIMVSISEESVDLGTLFERVKEELERKGLSINYQLIFMYSGGQVIHGDDEMTDALSTQSKSTFLSQGETLEMRFENASLIILKQGLVDILLSLLIIGVVFGVLTYLYRIIKDQKQLAMIKDDLISNITHEFKTPIATISTAIEGISSFNADNNKEKTERYLGISSDQLKKLNTMVEKLLETATIDSGELDVSKSSCDLVMMTRQVVDQFQLTMGDKQIMMDLPDESILFEVDGFHMENVLSNLIDNALKYGGDIISVRLTSRGAHPVWEVEDNGGHIEKSQREKIFEKLYRIPKGNQHDVKGFGIGLYYTRAIIEKHGGTIHLEVGTKRTVFKIEL